MSRFPTYLQACANAEDVQHKASAAQLKELEQHMRAYTEVGSKGAAKESGMWRRGRTRDTLKLDSTVLMDATPAPHLPHPR